MKSKLTNIMIPNICFSSDFTLFCPQVQNTERRGKIDPIGQHCRALLQDRSQER